MGSLDRHDSVGVAMQNQRRAARLFRRGNWEKKPVVCDG